MKTNKPILLVTATLEFMPDLKIEIQKKFKLIYKNQASYLDTMKILNKFKVEAWICNPCPTYEINSLLISKCKSLKVVATPSTGINHFSKEIFQIKNLKIFSLKDSTLLKSIKASSEYTFIFMASFIRKINEGLVSVKKDKWRDYEKNLRGRELNSLTLGIFGYGRIGSNLAKYSNAFGMKIFAFDPYVKKFHRFVTKIDVIETMLAKIDILAICATLNDSTVNFFNNKIFKKCKKGIIIVNTSRGEIINEKDLIKNIKNKRISGCALDVVSNENKKNFTSELINFSKKDERLYITPHIAGLTYDSEKKAQNIAFNFIKNYFKI